MKKSLLSILCMLCATFAMQAAEVTIDFSKSGYSNGAEVKSATIDENITATFAQGESSNSPKYYTSGTGVRLYAKNLLTIKGGEDVTISKVVITASGESYVLKAETVSAGTYETSGAVGTWTGSANEFTLCASNTSRNQKITVTYEGGKVTPTLTVIPKGDIKMATGLNATATSTITFETKALTEPISASVDNANFTLSASSVALDDAGKGLTISYTGTKAEATDSATITFKSGDVTATTSISVYTAAHAGTEADPLTVADVIAMNNANSNAFYVKGYIVGCVNNSALVASGTFLNSNIALADAEDETSFEKLSSAQLVSGTSARTYLNLADNPGNLGQQVVVKGTLEAYNSTTGIKNTEYISGLSATVTDYATLKEWIAAAPAGLKQGRVTGNVSVIYQNGSNLYIKDSSATILVYGELTNTYKNGDVLTGITGTYQKTSAGVPEFIPVADSFGTATSGTEVAPEVLAVEDLATDMINNYVEIDKVKLVAAEVANNYTATDETGSVVVYNKFGLTITEGENITVKGFVGIYSNTLQIMPIEVSAASGVENVNVNDANAPVEYFNLQGVKVANDNLSNGVYIRRQGTSVSKVLVK
jgi:DNA/RNA endonuclease YhcR with UshA esterase domain